MLIIKILMMIAFTVLMSLLIEFIICNLAHKNIPTIITSSISESDFIENIVETDNYNTDCYVALREI